MSIIIKPFSFFPGTVIRSAEVNSDFDTIYNDYNGNIIDVNIHLTSAKILVGNNVNQAVERTMSGDATISDTGVVTVNGSSGFLVPIGTIIPFYDFNGGLTFDPSIWAYCAGQTINVGSIGMQALPDLSNRYLVGFGTEGGGNIGTAPFSAIPVGPPSHQINLQHSHTVNAHNHSIGSHTHIADGHDHNFSGTTQKISTIAGGSRFQIDAGGHDLNLETADADKIGDHNHLFFGTTDLVVEGIGSTNLGNTGNTSPGTNNQLSTTQSIQPRSILVRFLMRVA